MDFWYEVIISEKINIDFQEIFDSCREEIEEDNEYQLNILIDEWQDWLEDKFGKDWWKNETKV